MAEAAETLTEAGKPPSRRRHRPVRRVWAHALWSTLVGLVVLVVVVAGLLFATGRTLEAPDWVRGELSARLEQSVDGALRLSFRDMALVVGEGWRPRVRFRDLVVRRPEGQELLRLSDTEVSFSVSALMRGEIRPKRVVLTGVFATLRIDADGAVALSVGDGGQAVEEAQSLPELIESWDVLLQEPVLRSLTQIDVRALTLRYEDGRAGRAWTVDGGRVTATREDRDLRLTGTFSLLSGRDYASTFEANYASRIGDPAATFGVTVNDVAAEDVATQSVALNWLRVLRAPISGAFRGSITGDGSIGPVNATLQIGQGVLQPTDTTRPIPFRQARTYFTYDPVDRKLVFDELSVESAWATGLADGVAYLNGIENGQLGDLVGQFRLASFSVNPAGLYSEPMKLEGATADFRLDLTPFRLELGQAQLSDADSTILLSGELAAGEAGWSVALDGWMDRLTPKRLLEVWPVSVVPKPREWIEENMLGGLMHGLNFALRATPGAPPDLYLDYDFSDASIRVVKWLPPLTKADGTVTMVDQRMVATATTGEVDSGRYGAVDVAGSSFIIPDVDVEPATPGVARIRAEGPVAAVMALLDTPPLSILKNSTLPVDMAEGRVRATGTLALPLKKKTKIEETIFHVEGTVENVDTTVLVPGHRITAEALEIDVDNERVVLSGPAEISGVPVEVSWRQPLGKPGEAMPSRLTGQVELSERAVEAFRIGLPTGSVSGTGRAEVEIDLVPGAPPVMRLTSDLLGVRLAIPALGWAKPESTGGELELTATLGEQPEVDRIALEAAGLRAQGRIRTRADGGLDRASLASVRIGNWFTGSVDIVGQGPSAPAALQVRGGRLDMRRATFGSGSGQSGPISVVLDSLQITETIALTDFRGRFGGAGGLTGEFSGLLGGRTPVTGDVVPQAGRSAFRIRSSDAGGVLRDAGLLTQARGGDFTMTLIPIDGPGNYDGSGQIRNTRVINAPAIAALLDAASIVGLLDELAGPGIQFSQVDARFRISPERMTLYESSAVGPSMGLSMDGIYDIGADRLSMQGVISPLYLINGIGAVLTRPGEGLIGFNYSLSGSAANPRVQVNPLSALAPGMLREVFRAPPPADPNAPEPGSRRSNPGAPDPLDGSAGGR